MGWRWSCASAVWCGPRRTESSPSSMQVQLQSTPYPIPGQKNAIISVISMLQMLGSPRLQLTLAFCAGVLLTLGYKDVYPDLERRYQIYRKRKRQQHARRSSLEPGQAVVLKDNSQSVKQNEAEVEIPDGIEGCIGNTPLFRIKSLSEATGCEILAKAEVRRH